MKNLNQLSICIILMIFFASEIQLAAQVLSKAEIATEKQKIVNSVSQSPNSINNSSVRAKISINKSGEICVLISNNLNKSAKSDTIDELIVVQTGLPQRNTQFQELGVVKLTSIANVGVLIENDKYLYFLGISNEKSNAILNNLKRKVNVGLGFGISTLRGKWNIPSTISGTNSSIFDNLHAYRIPTGSVMLDTRAVKCDNGGVGSTSCSITENFLGIDQSCDVSCGSGYYACCKSNVTCSCVKNPPDGGISTGDNPPVYKVRFNRISAPATN